MKEKVTIYTLAHPVTKEIFYVGRTRMPLSVRLSCHITSKAVTNKKLEEVFKKIRKTCFGKPIIEAIDTAEYENRKDAEEYWIHQLCAWGFDLVNIRFARIKGYQKKIISSPYTKEEKGLIEILYRHGDNTEIAKRIGVSDELIREYKKRKRCNNWVKSAIISFYKERAKTISQLDRLVA